MKIPAFSVVALASAVAIGATAAVAAPASASTLRATPRTAPRVAPGTPRPDRCGVRDGGPDAVALQPPFVVVPTRRSSSGVDADAAVHVTSDETFSVARVVSTNGGTTHVSFVATDLRTGKVVRLT